MKNNSINEKSTMKQKVIYITGISKGIGKEIAEMAIGKGYTVYGTSRKPEKIKNKIKNVNYVTLDLHNDKSIDSFIEKIEEIDILINNAGEFQLGPAEEVSVEVYRRVFESNLFGMIKIIQGVLPIFRAKRTGTIINIGSLAGKFALPYHSVYVSSKFALEGYTLSLRQEVSQFGVKVTLVAPNNIQTTFPKPYHCQEDSVYKNDIDAVWSTTVKKIEAAPLPAVVAKKVLKILNKNNPNPVYTTGGAAPLLAFAKRLMPNRLIEFLLRKSYKL